MKAWNLWYRNWSISVMALEGGWVVKCVPPIDYEIVPNWEAYRSLDQALVTSKTYIDKIIAIYLLRSFVAQLKQEGKLEQNDYQCLLSSLKAAGCPNHKLPNFF